MNEWLLIAGMMVLTFGSRYLPFALAGRLSVPPLMRSALSYVPIAVLTAIIAQASLIRDGTLTLNLDNHHLIATVMAFAVAVLTRHMFVTVVVGLLAFAAARWVL